MAGTDEWTNLVTLYLRAYESPSERTILGAAATAVERIERRTAPVAVPAVQLGHRQLSFRDARVLQTWTPQLDMLERRPVLASSRSS